MALNRLPHGHSLGPPSAPLVEETNPAALDALQPRERGFHQGVVYGLRVAMDEGVATLLEETQVRRVLGEPVRPFAQLRALSGALDVPLGQPRGIHRSVFGGIIRPARCHCSASVLECGVREGYPRHRDA